VFCTALTGTGLNEDVFEGIIDRFRSLPIARPAVCARACHSIKETVAATADRTELS
jgi:hypothetical protein